MPPISLGTGIHCPKCNREMTVTTGVLSGILFGRLVDVAVERFKREGGKITCPYCKTVSKIKAQKSA